MIGFEIWKYEIHLNPFHGVISKECFFRGNINLVRQKCPEKIKKLKSSKKQGVVDFHHKFDIFELILNFLFEIKFFIISIEKVEKLRSWNHESWKFWKLVIFLVRKRLRKQFRYFPIIIQNYCKIVFHFRHTILNSSIKILKSWKLSICHSKGKCSYQKLYFQ